MFSRFFPFMGLAESKIIMLLAVWHLRHKLLRNHYKRCTRDGEKREKRRNFNKSFTFVAIYRPSYDQQQLVTYGEKIPFPETFWSLNLHLKHRTVRVLPYTNMSIIIKRARRDLETHIQHNKYFAQMIKLGTLLENTCILCTLKLAYLPVTDRFFESMCPINTGLPV